MLILTRKPGQSLYIGDNIKVTIVEMKGHQIRVGIDAPRDFRIYREEIYLQILEENKSAAQASIDSEMEGLEGLGRAWRGPDAGDDDENDTDSSRKISGLGSSNFSTMKAKPTAGRGKDKSKPQVVVRKKRSKNRDE